MAAINQVVTVGDQVRLTKDLMGTVRFVGEIQGRKGIYYGIELTEAKGKSNGTVGNVRYFKCKNKRGLFLRFARIQEVIANNTIHRIGINDCIELYAGNRKSIGVVRYIGIPSRCKEIYYGIQFRKPIGDSDGIYHGTRYFTTNKKYAYFVKASSNHIVKIENEQQQQQQQQDTASSSTTTSTSTSTATTTANGTDTTTNNNNIIKQIELDIYSEINDDIDQPIFTITVSSNFSFNDLISSISKMSQYISSVFDIRFEPLKNGHSNGYHNGHNGNIHKKIASILNDEQLKLLRIHSFNFYEYGKFFVIEPLKKGIMFEEKGSYKEALKIYEIAVNENNESTEALTYYANCLVLLDKFDDAEEIYKKALDINPFCGDICYFYSRLLEYRDKYDEAKNLCNRIMNYVKKLKCTIPAPHHPIHYGCYARLGQKYCKLSLDRYNRSKINVQQKLQRLINEKKELQQQIDNISNSNSNSSSTSNTNITKLNELNQNIQKLEKQLLKKEEIIRDKDKQLISSENEIKSLQNELNRFRERDRKNNNNNNNNKEKESAAKKVSEIIIKNEGKEKKMEVEKEKKEKKEEKKTITTKTTKTKTKTKIIDDNNNNNDDDKKEKDLLSEYQPLFDRIDTKKRVFEERRERLLSGLLSCESLPSLSDCGDDIERQSLMQRKLELCAVICNFTIESSTELTRIENKKDLLLEVLQCMSGNKWNSIELLQQCIETIWINLFRSLPDANMIKTDASDDEMDFRDPSWDHLQLIYELTFHVVTNTHIDKKTMKKHLQGAFLENLIHLFSSADDREPQYVKIIVHAIYGRFMALRKSIRKHLSDYCYKYVYLSTLRDITSWQGLPEILEIFCSIFQGLNVPVKPDYHIVLRNVIVPLHKSFHLDEFHEQLLQCCTQFVTKDPYSAPVILGGMLKFWPKFSPLKEQLFITEIVHILNVCVRHPNIKQSDPKFATITIAVLNKFVQCMVSPHHQVAERSLMVWRDETVRICVDLHREKIWPNIYKALQHNKEKYWLSAIRNINRQIMSDFKRRDPEFFEKIEKQQQSQDIINNNNKKDLQQKELKQESREQRWIKLRQLAKPKNNK